MNKFFVQILRDFSRFHGVISPQLRKILLLSRDTRAAGTLLRLFSLASAYAFWGSQSDIRPKN